jgi:hypothetical protein
MMMRNEKIGMNTTDAMHTIATAGVAFIVLMLFFDTAYAITLDEIALRLYNNLTPVIKLLIAASYVIGVVLIVSAMNDLRVYGQTHNTGQGASLAGPFAKLFSGIGLMFLPSILETSIYTIWGSTLAQAKGDLSTLMYTASFSSVQSVKKLVLLVIVIYGYVSIIRGFLGLSRVGKQGAQPGATSKSVLHVVGGILAVNIAQLIAVIKATLGI